MDIWTPYPGMQTRMLQSIAYEILAGGARGPGKTDGGVVWLAKPYLLENPRARALVIRKNSDDLADWLDRARYYYPRYGGVVTGKPGLIRFPSGYTIRTGHLKDENAYGKYQGQEYQRMVVEELTQIPSEKLYLQLLGSCRSTIPGIAPQILSTTNPGGPGHVWVKERFVDPAPPNATFIGADTGRTRVFFPGRVEDNPKLMKEDPGYMMYLDSLRAVDEELWKAWRLGDWNVFAGRFFREFRRDIHVVKQRVIKPELPIIGGLDWGRTDPFSFHASIAYMVKYSGADKTNPKDFAIRDYTFTRILTFQECYGVEKSPGEWAKEIAEKINLDKLTWIQCDNQIFNPLLDTSASIADQFYASDSRFYGKLLPASKDRINGWENMHKWLSIAPDGFPYWLIMENCVNLIKEIPDLQHDDINVEDTMQGQGILDHASDESRYMLKAVKFIDAKLGGVNPKAMLQLKSEQKYASDRPVEIDLFT